MKKIAKHTGLGKARRVGGYIQEEILSEHNKKNNPKPKPVLGLRGRFEQDYLSKVIDLNSLAIREGDIQEVLTKEEKKAIKDAIEKFVKDNTCFNDSKGIKSVSQWAKEVIDKQIKMKDEKIRE